MADEFKVRLSGIAELKKALGDAPEKIRARAIRGALRKGAMLIRNEAKMRAPVLRQPDKEGRFDFRAAPGVIRNRISVRPSGIERKKGNEGVFVGVKPLRGAADARKFGKRGAGNRYDPYYWWWQEFGWAPRGPGKKLKGSRQGRKAFQKLSLKAGIKRVPGKHFLRNAARAKGNEAVAVFMRTAIPQIEKLNARASAKATT
jgi:HK97 gp10 family phage protein